MGSGLDRHAIVAFRAGTSVGDQLVGALNCGVTQIAAACRTHADHTDPDFRPLDHHRVVLML